MAYYNNDQLLKYFEKNMKQVADQNIETLKLEIKKLYQKEMSKIQEALTIKHELEKNRELKSLTIIHQEKINHLGIEYDATLMNLRKNMVADIFETVTKRIKSYMTTKAYITSMSDKIKTYADQYEHKNLRSASPGSRGSRPVARRSATSPASRSRAGSSAVRRRQDVSSVVRAQSV